MAEASSRSALTQDPQYLDALSGLAWIYLRSGKNLDLAGFLAERALALAPTTRSSTTRSGARDSRLVAARRPPTVRSGVGEGPDRAELLHFLGAARLAQGQRDAARRRLERVLEVAPDYAQAAAVRALFDQLEWTGRRSPCLQINPRMGRRKTLPPDWELCFRRCREGLDLKGTEQNIPNQPR